MRSSKSAHPTGAGSPITTDADARAFEPAAYPPPPWRLVGPAVVAMALVDVERAAAFVPPDLDIVEVLPGRTLGAVYVADYQDSATLPYGELGVMPALVRGHGATGAWISNIWVDSQASMAGGREMWGMYKYLAEFRWSAGTRNAVTVSAEGRPMVTLTWTPPRRLLPAPGLVVGIGSVDGDRRRFTGRGISRMAPTPVAVDVAEDSPFADLQLDSAKVVGAAGRIDLAFDGIRVLTPSPSPATPAARTT